jgi:hypothetical protein
MLDMVLDLLMLKNLHYNPVQYHHHRRHHRHQHQL